MVYPFICGSASLNQQLEDDRDEANVISPSSPPPRPSKQRRLSKLDDKRQRIYTQAGADEISFVRFVYSSGSNDCKPIVVRAKDHKQLHQEKAHGAQPVESIISEESSSKLGNEVDPLMNDRSGGGGKRKRFELDFLRVDVWRRPYFYLGMVKKFEDDECPKNFQSLGLIIRATGIVGNSLAEILPLSDTAAATAGGLHGTPATRSTTSSATSAMPMLPSPSSPPYRRHPPNLHHLDQPIHRDRQLRRHCRPAPPRPRGGGPQRPQSPPHLPSDRHLTLPRALRVFRRGPAPRAGVHGGHAEARRPQLLLGPRRRFLQSGRRKKRIVVVGPPAGNDFWILPI
ncbi:NAD(P)-binding Rossmann-fold superfamily protein [Actinidia rufa]|uniref:NAD(P)-binding Rossmann-fold superfamily protein n=1 Tax=Actinidia rufa TaxID=165716 RepID=A0A7J0FB93_9ERIC|nr:NAD(P)-binding Rossmann-fold superfamily protein [Actinidia rufa]